MPSSTHPLFSCSGGSIVLPARVLCDRRDGGHLIVDPPRPVWERGELAPLELAHWAFLVAATGRAMLDRLPALRGGCLNYWEAGNWSLHPLAEPPGPKDPLAHRRVHLHVFGRSPRAQDPDWRWGESPRFPDFVDAPNWAARFAPLSPDECQAVAERAGELFHSAYLGAARDSGARP